MTQLKILKEHPEIYTELNAKGDWFYEGLDEAVKASGTGWHMNHIGSLGCMYFTGQPVVDYASAKTGRHKGIRKVVPLHAAEGLLLRTVAVRGDVPLSSTYRRKSWQGVLDAAKAYFAERA